MRNLTEGQTQLLELKRTRPTWVVELDFTGATEYLCTNGDITINGQVYTGSDLGIENISDWSSAKVKLFNTNERTAAIFDGGWQGNACKIYKVPVADYKQLVQDGYFQEDYAIQGYYQEDAFLVLDGVLTDGQDNGDHISLTVTHKALAGQTFPPLRITNQTFNHLPEQGSQFEFDGYVYTMETAR